MFLCVCVCVGGVHLAISRAYHIKTITDLVRQKSKVMSFFFHKDVTFFSLWRINEHNLALDDCNLFFFLLFFTYFDDGSPINQIQPFCDIP